MRRDLNWGNNFKRREVLDIQQASRKAWDNYRERTALYNEALIDWRTRSKSARIEMPPRDRPMAALKRDIYRLACDIYDKGHQEFLEVVVLHDHQSLELTPKLRSKTVIDWTVRLVRYVKAKRLSAAEGGSVTELFSGMTQTRIVTELDFAFANNIHPELCTTFIKELGGYEIIGLMLTEEKNAYYGAAWVREMQGAVRVQAQKPEGTAGSRRIAWQKADKLQNEDWEDDECEDVNFDSNSLIKKCQDAQESTSTMYTLDSWEEDGE